MFFLKFNGQRGKQKAIFSRGKGHGAPNSLPKVDPHPPRQTPKGKRAEGSRKGKDPGAAVVRKGDFGSAPVYGGGKKRPALQKAAHATPPPLDRVPTPMGDDGANFPRTRQKPLGGWGVRHHQDPGAPPPPPRSSRRRRGIPGGRGAFGPFLHPGPRLGDQKGGDARHIEPPRKMRGFRQRGETPPRFTDMDGGSPCSRGVGRPFWAKFPNARGPQGSAHRPWGWS